MNYVVFSFALVIFTLSASVSEAAPLAEKAARSAAMAILKGDPYGNNPQEISKNIAGAKLVSSGVVCGAPVKQPLWTFQIFVAKNRNPSGDRDIRGELAIDGQTGKLVCATLPFLD